MLNKINHWLRSQIGISKSEANGIIILLPLMFLFIISPYWFHRYKARQYELETNIYESDSLVAYWRSQIIIDSLSNVVEPYTSHRYSEYKNRRYDKPKPKTYSKPKRTYIPLEAFDINTADTIALKKVRGIGGVLSKRIIKYRDVLGGFTSKSQLSEVYGLKDSVIRALDTLVTISHNYQPKQIEINIVDEYTLARHPYFSKSLAKAIINYRFQHGPFQELSDIQNIHQMDSLKMLRILPYIKI